MDFPTFDRLFRLARAEMLRRNGLLRAEVIDREGSDANVICGAIAAAADEVVGQLARLEADLTLGSAKKQALDRLAFDRFTLLRKPASASLGSVEFSLPTPSVGAFSIPAGTKLLASDGKAFITVVSATFPAASSGPVTVGVRSTLAGSTQNVAPGAIRNISSAITGAPAGLTVTNPLRTAGGDDVELDEAFQARSRAYFSSVRRGTLLAIQQQALSTAGVRTAMAFEGVDTMGRPGRYVQLVVADAFVEQLATLQAVPPTYPAASQALAQLVYQNLSDTRGAGIYVEVNVAKVVLQSVTLALSFKADFDQDEAAVSARAAVVAYTNALPPGTAWTPAGAVESLRRVRGLLVTGSEVYSPAGIVTPSPLEAIRTTLGLVKAISVQPDRALAGTANSDA